MNNVTYIINIWSKNSFYIVTRMHSSGMRRPYSSLHCAEGGVSGRSLGKRGCVYPSRHWAGGWVSAEKRGVCPGGCLPRGLLAQEVCLPG